ncbi:MAG: DUF1501 domain-containing protein [Oceanospirillaceae bacterium]|nr:DUF1501 domain-containing protein [Oceanospirillaceae bacterium]
MQRRDFLNLSASAATVAIASSFSSLSLAAANKMPVLILIELNGGNDSHNTVIDLNQLGVYQQLRPQLGLAEDERVRLDKNYALHRSLAGFIAPWQSGELALVHGLGYPEANKSHFRSIEIWDMASAHDEYLSAGWLANILPKISKSEIDALIFGRNGSAFAGGSTSHVQLDNLQAYFNKVQGVKASQQATVNSALKYLLGLNQTIVDSKTLLMRGLAKEIKLKTEFPSNVFGRQMADIAKVIRMDLQIPAFKIALGSFDTHKSQKGKHQQLLKQLADGMLALRAELIISGHWPSVMMMTYSEFGRRAAQNGSGGSDHGTAASHFLLGGRVRGGHFGDYPSLSELVDRDVMYNTDFRAVYQSVVRQWWGQPQFQLATGLDELKLLHSS